MNNRSEVLRRLLKSYPVNLLRKEFNIDSRSQWDVIEEVILNTSLDNIETFCFRKFGHVKQHKYVYKVDDIDVNNFDNYSKL